MCSLKRGPEKNKKERELRALRGEKVFREMKRKLLPFRVQRPSEPRPWLPRRRDAFRSWNNAIPLVTNWITNNAPDTHARMRLFFPAWCMHMKAAPMPNETRASARARSLRTSATDLSTSRTLGFSIFWPT